MARVVLAPTQGSASSHRSPRRP